MVNGKFNLDVEPLTFHQNIAHQKFSNYFVELTRENFKYLIHASSMNGFFTAIES
jgi:hypothetical protein